MLSILLSAGFTSLIVCCFALYVAHTSSKNQKGIGVLLAVAAAVIGMWMIYLQTIGRPTTPQLTFANDHIYCISAKVGGNDYLIADQDTTYYVRTSDQLPQSGCFEKTLDGNYISVKPAKDAEGRRVGIPVGK